MAPPRPSRTDPYKTFKFRVLFEGRVVAGAAKVSAVKAAPRGFGASRKLPALHKAEQVKLERGMTQDAEFERWMTGAAPQDPPRDLTIELLDLQGQVARVYRLRGARPSSFAGLPDLDANAHSLVFENLVIEAEGWDAEPLEK